MGLLIVLILLVILFPLAFFKIITMSFGKIGLSLEATAVLLVVTLICGLINIPLSRQGIIYRRQRHIYSDFFFYFPPKVTRQVIMVNVGGAVIPMAFSIYLLTLAPLLPALIATVIVILLNKYFATLDYGLGITAPIWISVIFSAGLALILARDNPGPVAYISGTMGTLIGADLLNWPNYKILGAQIISIGGFGVYDAIFMSGIVAVLITSL